MKLLAYILDNKIIGVEIETWYDDDLDGNSAFMAVEDNFVIPSNYIEVSSIENWDKFGGLTILNERQIKTEIAKLKPEYPTEVDIEIFEEYSMIPQTIILNGVCELVDNIGEQNLNYIIPVSINWGQQDIIDNDIYIHNLNTSEIYVKKNGYYEISYSVNSMNTNNSRLITGIQIRCNGSSLIGKTLSASYSRNKSNDDNHNSIPPCTLYLNENEYIEIVGFRLGDNKDVETKKDASFVRLKYLGK